MKQKMIRIFSLLLLGGGALVASAQFHLGPRAGLNLANLTTNEAGVEHNSLIGISGGVTAQYQFWKTLSVQLDALYSMQGAKSVLITEADAGGIKTTTRIDGTRTFNYVSVPLMINWEIPIKPKTLVPYFIKEQMASFHLYGGGFFGYALGGEFESTTTQTIDDGFNTPVTNTSSSAETLAKAAYNPVDFGIAAGAGFSFKIGDRSKLYVDARYLMGFADVAKDANIKHNNRVIQPSLAYVYRITRAKRY